MPTKKKTTRKATKKKAAPRKKTTTGKKSTGKKKMPAIITKIRATAKKMYANGEAKTWPAAMKKAAKHHRDGK